MEELKLLVYILLPLFLLYMLTYILQWLVGLLSALDRFSAYRELKTLVVHSFTDSLALKYPVTVLIPAHNEENCIRGTVDALLQENYPGLRICIVDDGSTDQTFERLRSQYQLQMTEPKAVADLPTQDVIGCYSAQIEGKEILVIRKTKGGKADALNCGLNYCRTAYVLICDADTQIQRGSVKIMVSRFMDNPRTVVCAGAVGSERGLYPKLSFLRRILVNFQTLEYYRTFYMQRILLNRINANIVVSGAFAMFDVDVLRSIGGYCESIIGEDMELTMRLHAFCASQNRPYSIAYTPAAKCFTQFPFRYVDYYRQRRRWQIGMMQSMHQHKYMCGNLNYGWAGVMSGSLYLLYELLAPFIEIVGIITLLLSFYLQISVPSIFLLGTVLYLLLIALTQAVLVTAINAYGLEKISFGRRLTLLLTSFTEFLFFHTFNTVIKLLAFARYRRNKETWGQIKRASGRAKTQ